MSRVALLVTGASGMLLPVHALRALLRCPAIDRVHLVVSEGARRVLVHELGHAGAADAAAKDEATADAIAVPDGAGAGEGLARTLAGEGGGAGESDRLRIHPDSELDAEIASGSYRLDATVILPCSSGTLGALATGLTTTLIHRAGQVALKERWPLVLGFRETPLSLVHLENLRRLAYAGAVLLPPIPAFYVGERGRAEDLGRFLDAYVMRVLDCARIPSDGVAAADLRWRGGKRERERQAR